MNKSFFKVPIFVLMLIIVVGPGIYVNEALAAVGQSKKVVTKKTAKQTVVKIGKFGSAKEYLAYLSKIKKSSVYAGPSLMAPSITSSATSRGLAGSTQSLDTSGQRADYSQTNVQVVGVDEPDIVKTNGSKIFISNQDVYWHRFAPMDTGAFDMRAPFVYRPSYLSVIDSELQKKINDIEETGEMLLSKNTLIIFTSTGVSAYNISDINNISKAWRVEYQGAHLQTARLLNDEIYIVTSKGNLPDTCNYTPFSLNGAAHNIKCTSIYRPSVPVSDAGVVSAFKLDSLTGKVRQSVSMMAGTYNTTVYMSQGSLYLAYDLPVAQSKLLNDFVINKAFKDMPVSLRSQVIRALGQNVDEYIKLANASKVISDYTASLSYEERKIKNASLGQLLKEYINESRSLWNRTAIAKISLKDFRLIASNEVAGRLVNQFALDEYNDVLRVATTITPTPNFYLSDISINPQDFSISESYTFNKDLALLDKVSDLGLSERIYSVRFVKDRGYIVTFRTIDPFYVLDLADPKNIKIAGELKIPGFSSYLHPLENNTVLGVGQEAGKIKLSMFDVADASNPLEVSKYIFENEGWSQALSNHKAFLQDEARQLFFIPTYGAYYVFSYKDKKIALVKEVKMSDGQRVVIIGGNAYFVDRSQVIILNMDKAWEQVGQLEYKQKNQY